MKKEGIALFIIVFFIVLSAVCAVAETLYITDRLEVVVRGGRGIEYRILAVVKTDEEVDVLGYEGNYARVKTSRDIEGWMLKRYLTMDTPKTIVIGEYEEQTEMLKEKGSGAGKKMLELHESVKTLKKTKKEQGKRIRSIEKDYSDLKIASADFLKLKKEQKNLEKQMKQNSQRLSRTTEENRELKKQTKIKWFIAGGAAVLIGFILGMYLQRLRNEKRRHLSF